MVKKENANNSGQKIHTWHLKGFFLNLFRYNEINRDRSKDIYFFDILDFRHEFPRFHRH